MYVYVAVDLELGWDNVVMVTSDEEKVQTLLNNLDYKDIDEARENLLIITKHIV